MTLYCIEVCRHGIWRAAGNSENAARARAEAARHAHTYPYPQAVRVTTLDAAIIYEAQLVADPP